MKKLKLLSGLCLFLCVLVLSNSSVKVYAEGGPLEGGSRTGPQSPLNESDPVNCGPRVFITMIIPSPNQFEKI